VTEFKKICFFCSAWNSFNFSDSKNFGYCARYALKTQAYEWCETWDEKRDLGPRKARSYVIGGEVGANE